MNEFKGSDMYRSWNQIDPEIREEVQDEISRTTIDAKISNCRDGKTKIVVNEILVTFLRASSHSPIELTHGTR